MSESKALTVRQEPLSLTTWQVIQAIAPTMHQSRLFGVASAEQAAAIMVKGAELGLSLSASFEFIAVIQGKPSLSPRGALALVMSSGLLADMKLTKHGNPIGYTCYMKRTNGLEHSETFTVEDAMLAGLVKAGGAWEFYPWNMSKWRAVGFTIDVLFPDVTGGMKRADEFGAPVNAQGEVIEAEWQPAPAQPAEDRPEATVRNGSVMWPVPTLDELTARFGAEAVLQAGTELGIAGGIPGDTDAITRVARTLGFYGAEVG